MSKCPPAKRARGNLKIGIGDQGPMGRVLIRGERGHGLIEQSEPLPSETGLLADIEWPFCVSWHSRHGEWLAKCVALLPCKRHPIARYAARATKCLFIRKSLILRAKRPRLSLPVPAAAYFLANTKVIRPRARRANQHSDHEKALPSSLAESSRQ
jgi:hypothetical protein